jgi:uncharacterized membrane protein YjjP (DUF1212 family)
LGGKPEVFDREEAMSEEREQRPRGEKDEKQEKPDKQEEKEEKSWDEKWRRDPLNAAAWAVILMWAGVVLLASNFRLLDWIPFLEGWSLFFLGASAILLLEIVLRLILPSYRQPVAGNFIVAIIFLAIGLGNIVDWKCIGPLVIIGIGAYLLVIGVLRRRE